jgi:hypothetical protein
MAKGPKKGNIIFSGKRKLNEKIDTNKVLIIERDMPSPI